MKNPLKKSTPGAGKSEPYDDSWEHIADELALLDIRIKILLLLQPPAPGENPYPQFKGLVIPEEEVYELLNVQGGKNISNAEIEPLLDKLRQLKADIENRRRSSKEKGVFLSLAYLSQVFDLSTFEEKCLVICLAPEIDRKYEKLYAYLQDDATCKYPTIDLAVKLLCASREAGLAARMSFSPGEKLSRFFLKEDDRQPSGISLSRPLRLDERIISFFLHPGRPDDFIKSYAELLHPEEDLPPLLLGLEVQDQIRKFVKTNYSGDGGHKNIVFCLTGPSGSGKKLQTKHFCRFFNQALLIVDLAKTAALDIPFSRLAEIAGREAILQQLVLCFDNFHVLMGEEDRKKIGQLFEIIKMLSGVVFLLTETPWKAAGFTRDHLIIDIDLGIPSESERKRLWEHFSGGITFDDGIEWGTLAGKFRFTPGQIKHAIESARNMSSWHYEEFNGIKTDELYKACYRQAQHKLEKRAGRIQPKYTWDDVILPAEQKNLLRNACNQMKHRHIVYGEWGFERKLSYGKGLSMLFSGPPGTGKTMSAQAVASELYMELYRIDLSQVVSKYIGETEKNLQLIFHEAELSNAILFFDETDALFGKRSEIKDSHDRYANIETAFLLQKVEEYEGITIMATNFKQNIDEAFMRRISFVIEFPFPNAEYRKKIWKSMFTPETPLSEDIDFDFIAERLEIAGGNIKNIVLSAAFLAAEAGEPVGMRHIIRAARYELQKIGKILLKEDLGEYSNYL